MFYYKFSEAKSPFRNRSSHGDSLGSHFLTGQIFSHILHGEREKDLGDKSDQRCRVYMSPFQLPHLPSSMDLCNSVE